MTSRRNIFALTLTLLLAACHSDTSDTPVAEGLGDQVSGLWVYTGLTTSDGQELPLEGIFLFKDGTFLQHAVFKGEPVAAQGAMAHAGPYRVDEASIHLTAAPTISTAPGESPGYQYRASTEHDITVERKDSALTLTFSMGTGTEQRFDYVGPGTGHLYTLSEGAFALVDDRFILVQGNESASIAGYGRAQQSGNNLTLTAELWTEVNEAGAVNRRDHVMQATLDEEALTFVEGPRFPLSH